MRILSLLGFFFFQAEDGIRDLVRSRGLGDVYKRQEVGHTGLFADGLNKWLAGEPTDEEIGRGRGLYQRCLLYTSDAADDLLCVDLGGRRTIKKKNVHPSTSGCHPQPY